jgi:CRP-like cAMP-binding protein
MESTSMLEQTLVRPHPQSDSVPRDSRLGLSARHTPRQNRLLAALPAENYERLLPHLELVPLPLGWAVYEAGTKINYLYFPTCGILSWIHVTKNGAPTGISIVGNDGLIGVALIMRADTSARRVVVHSAGYAYRLRADVLNREFERGRALQQLLLRYAQALITQVAQTAVCNRHHSVVQQLCRWLLLSLDRLPSNELTMTQELIANMLGVRREGVTEAAGHLQKAGLIQYRRGHITVPDRSKLESMACECYAVVKEEFERLLPDPTSVDIPSRIGTARLCARQTEKIAA